MFTKKKLILLQLFVIVSQSFFSQDLSERIGVCTSVKNAALLKNAGCSYVEIGIRDFFMPTKPDSAFAENRKDASESSLPLLTGNGFFPGEIRLTGPEVDIDKTIRYAEVAMQRAQQTGTKVFVLGSGNARNIPDNFDRTEAVSQFVGLCKQIALLGEKYGVVVVIEPLRKEETNFINTVREGMEIVRAVHHPNLLVLADFYHMACVGEDAQALVEAGASLHHCHIAEKDERTAPGIKGDDFTPYFKALKQINYRGRLSIECGWKNLGEEIGPAVAEIKRQIRSID
jgi:sugar phosphate isomerase/epimerase